MAFGIGAITFFLRGVIAFSLPDYYHWFIALAPTSDYDTVFRIIGAPIFAGVVGYVFSLVARRQWPAYYDEAEKQRLANLQREQPSRPRAGEPIPPIRIVGFFVVMVATILCYDLLPDVGQAVLIILDRIAFGTRWLDVNVPALSWLLVGALMGGVTGFAMGIRRAGAPKLAPRVVLTGIAALGVLFILGLGYAGAMPPTHPRIVNRVTNTAPVNVNVWAP
jgi:hypothetical protein